MSWYYGMDGNSPGTCPCKGDGPNFYIGRLGGGVTAGGTGWEPSAPAAYTFAYWDVVGPGGSGGILPNQWGVDQANAFITAWENKHNTGAINGLTLFGDVEDLNGGWGTGDLPANQEVLSYFLETINMYFTYQGQYDFDAGVYISSDNWDTFFGSSYTSPQPFVLWQAGTNCPSDCSTAAADFPTATVGGYKPMIWQYLVTGNPPYGCGASQDLDISPYSGYQNSKWNPTT